MTSEKMREAFENWFFGENEKPEIIKRGRKLQSYYDKWTTWQAAPASMPRVTEEELAEVLYAERKRIAAEFLGVDVEDLEHAEEHDPMAESMSQARADAILRGEV